MITASGASARETKTFHTLNGMRGVAAVAVVIWHAEQYFDFKLTSSYLAVDLFFVLSGYVLAHAYEGRFERGMGVLDFMKIRFIRLFPLFSLGVAITLISVIIGWASGAHLTWTPGALALSAALNALFLPAPPLHGTAIFPLNVPGWSLFFELFVNLLYVLSWRVLSNRVLVAIIVAAAVALAACADIFDGLTGGWLWSDFIVGFARVLFSFPAGILVWRLTRDWPPIRLSGWWPIAIMVLIFAIEPGSARAAYDAGAVVVGLPLLVMVASLTRPHHSIWLFNFLGAISYGLYAIHDPVMKFVNGIVIKLMGTSLERFAPWLGFGFLTAVTVGVWLLDKYYDAPVRRWMSGGRQPPRAEYA